MSTSKFGGTQKKKTIKSFESHAFMNGDLRDL